MANLITNRSLTNYDSSMIHWGDLRSIYFCLGYTYGEGWGIAGLKCGAITCRVYPQCRGNDGVLVLGSLPQGDFLLLPVCGAYSRALKAEKP